MIGSTLAANRLAFAFTAAVPRFAALASCGMAYPRYKWLSAQPGGEYAHPGGITVRPAEAGDEADPHWVVPGCEDDWNRCGRRFGGARRDSAACGGQYAYSAADKVCHYRGQSFDLIESVAILNCDVLPLDIAVFGKTTPEFLANAAIAASRVGWNLGAAASELASLRNLLANDYAATYLDASFVDVISARRWNVGWMRGISGSARWSRCHNRFESNGLDH